MDETDERKEPKQLNPVTWPTLIVIYYKTPQDIRLGIFCSLTA